MMIRYCLAILLYSILPFCSLAQNENNVWTFGNELGLDFNSPSPTIFRSRILAKEGCASICDPSGNLLFYSNGQKVWDSTHTVMPNGLGIMGHAGLSCTQGVSIAPVFGHPNKYFLFTIDEFNMEKSGYLRYSVIDMSLNGGKGDIMPGIKNNNLDTGMGEKMIIAPACNGLWLITHHIDSPIFYAYKIDNPIFVNRPVISNTGGAVGKGLYYVGEMKLSPDQKTIANGNWISEVFGYSAKSPVEIFDFDRISGKISNGKAIDSSNYAYSIEYSPDNSKFYMADFDSSLYQYDLSLLPNLAAVRASKTKLLGDNFTSLRRAPDNKIYVNRHNYFTEISRINAPNALGLACNLEIDVPALSNASSAVYLMFGNSTLRPTAGSDTSMYTKKDTIICNGDIFNYQADMRRSDFKWHDGSTLTSRNFTIAGTYWISSRLGCTQYVDTFVIGIKEKKITYTSTNVDLCFKKEYLAAPKLPATELLWSDGSSGATYTFTQSGSAWVMSSNKDCNIAVDSFKVKLTDFVIAIPDTFICTQDTLHFQIKLDSVATYLWHDNSTKPNIIIDKPGNYWAFVTVGNCNKKEEFTVFQKSFAVNFRPDTFICEGEVVKLEVTEPNVQYLWQDGSTSSFIEVKQKGTYTVRITQGNCTTVNNAFVDVIQCENCMHIPNAFTPNNDLINDKFKVITGCIIDNFSMTIFNRWGEQVFASENYNTAWDGSFGGIPLNAGVYFYMVKVKFRKPGSKEELHKGEITLIR